MKGTNTCIFCKREFSEHNPKQALNCINKIVGGVG